MATMTATPAAAFALSPAEQRELEQLEKDSDQILSERSEFDRKITGARYELEEARSRHSDASIAAASGQKADISKWAAEISRLEGLIVGYQRLRDQKSEQLKSSSIRSGELIEKRSRLELAGERERLGEAVRVAEANVKAARENLELAEIAAIAARRARASVTRP